MATQPNGGNEKAGAVRVHRERKGGGAPWLWILLALLAVLLIAALAWWLLSDDDDADVGTGEGACPTADEGASEDVLRDIEAYLGCEVVVVGNVLEVIDEQTFRLVVPGEEAGVLVADNSPGTVLEEDAEVRVEGRVEQVADGPNEGETGIAATSVAHP